MKVSKDNQISCQVIRSQRSTADIIIERDGSVLVRAPMTASDEQLATLVESKQLAIYEGLTEWQELNATRVTREYKNGECFLYLGRSHRLQCVDNQNEALQLNQGRFTLRNDLVKQGDVTEAKKAFQNFYTSKGIKRIQQRVEYYSPKVGVSASSVEVKELGLKWASCSSSGKLSFHWKCVMAPQSVIDYIIVHELCHIHHHNHTNAFWNEVDKVMSNYRDQKDWLRKNGAGLDI